MAIDITSLTITDEFGNDVTDFSLCNVQDKLTIVIAVTISEYAIASNDNNMIMNYTTGVILGGGYWLHDPQGQFDVIKIGDILERKDRVTNAVLNATINVVDKLDNFNIKIDTDLAVGFNDVATSGSIFNIKTPITALNYLYNFIENSEGANYASKVDGTIQQLSVNGITTASGSTPMVFQGAKPYQIGSASVVGSGLNTTIIYGQKFTITHNTFFTPFFLSDQLTDLLNGINAPYFQNTNCLKNIFKIEALYNYLDPNRVLTYESSSDINLNLIGNSGGYNENFNTGLTNYSIGSLNYDGGAISEIELILGTTKETDFTFAINNTNDSPFVNSNTKFTVQFIKVPTDSIDYTNNLNTLKENFVFDRCLKTLGAAASNGDNFATGYQVLKSVTSTIIGATQIFITGKISFGADAIAKITESNEYRYLLSVSVQDHTRVNLDSDRVNLIVDLNTFYVNTTDTGMIVIDNTFLQHPFNNIDTESTTDLSLCFEEDELVAQSLFYIDTVGRETDDIVITSVESKYKAINTSTDAEFDLDRYSVNMANLPLMGGYQYIDLSVPRVYHIPTTEIRKNILVKRRTDLDSAGKIYFAVTYPVMLRWEYWLPLVTANADFFDLAEPQNGLNNSWFRYSNNGVANWITKYEFIVNATKNGLPQQYKLSNEIIVGEAKGTAIKTYNTANVEQTNGADRYILGTEDTTVVATFDTMPSGFALVDCCVVIAIEVFEQGGIIGRRRFSSVNVQTTDTWFKTSNVTGLVDLAIASATVLTATCKLDYTLLPANLEYSISARLYYLPEY